MINIFDSFNRANGALGSADSGQAWTVTAGTFDILSNKLRCTTGGVKPGAYIDHESADGTFKLSIGVHNVDVGLYSGLLLRWIDQNNFIRAWIYNDVSNNYGLYVDMYDAGVYSNPIINVPIIFADLKVLSVVLTGAKMQVYYDGVLKATQAGLINVTGTKHGFYAEGDRTGKTLLMDDWVGDGTSSHWGRRLTRLS